MLPLWTQTSLTENPPDSFVQWWGVFFFKVFRWRSAPAAARVKQSNISQRSPKPCGKIMWQFIRETEECWQCLRFFWNSAAMETFFLGLRLTGKQAVKSEHINKSTLAPKWLTRSAELRVLIPFDSGTRRRKSAAGGVRLWPLTP